jgi:two-component system, cell cycle response regulator DivK
MNKQGGCVMNKLEPEAASTVMVVEDCTSNMMLFCDLLERVGFDTLRAETGFQAIRLASTHRPDLILLDIRLPDIDGTKVVRWLRANKKLCDVPVVAITAFALPGDKERILDAGFDAYVAKPISVRDFLEVVERFVGAKSPSFDRTAMQMDARC